jgi:hypothetical protein
MAGSLSRAVWAVVGAFGLLLVTSHFVDETDVVRGLVPFFGEGDADEGLDTWELALVYAGLGVVYVLLGQLLRQPVTHEDLPPPE